MAHYAYVDSRNIVTQVIVGKDENEPLPAGHDSWESYYGAIRCSYNTYGGVHRGPDLQPDGGEALRKNYPGVGWTWDPARDAFYAPQPYPSWTLDEGTCTWQPPVAHPDDGAVYYWNEETQSWDLVEGTQP